jgi:hypothetical protein
MGENMIKSFILYTIRQLLGILYEVKLKTVYTGFKPVYLLVIQYQDLSCSPRRLCMRLNDNLLSQIPL